MLRCKQQGRGRFRPALEVLEGRLTPSTFFHWVGGRADDPTAWADGRNWDDENGNQYAQDRYPGHGYFPGADNVMFDSNATTDCILSASVNNLSSISSDTNFVFSVELDASLFVDNTLTVAGGVFKVNGTDTYSGQVVIKQNGQVSVGTSGTLVCNGDAAYTWNADTQQHASLVVDSGSSLFIDGGGAVRVAKSAFFPNKGSLQFTDRGDKAWFIGSGGEAWFDGGVIKAIAYSSSRNFNLEFEGINVHLSRDSSVYLGVFTTSDGQNSYWAGIDVILLGADGGNFFVDTRVGTDSVTLNMTANRKPVGSSHTLIYAEVDMSGDGTDTFQNFTKAGNWQAWTGASCQDDHNFNLTY
jgi:hypothetical protein